MMVRAKAAGEVGPAAEDEVTTPPEGMEDSCVRDFPFLLFLCFSEASGSASVILFANVRKKDRTNVEIASSSNDVPCVCSV